jgi:hypothetical protein
LLHDTVAVGYFIDAVIRNSETITVSPVSLETLILTATASGVMLLVFLALSDNICSRSLPVPIYSSLNHSKIGDPLVVHVKVITSPGQASRSAFNELSNSTAISFA